MTKKNKVSKKEVEKIASLARLSLSEKELESRTNDMNNILNYMDSLNEINTDGVEELLNVHDMNNSLREDEYSSSISKKDVLKNSPSKNENYIEVPLTVKKDRK
tara:strand:- start:1376 stop:1687 length:312 start_codon:yes stop_codon:yes gene_type:complete